MYIHRIIMKDVRSIKDLDITLQNDWTQEPLKSVLLTGPNGSGKTTVLKAISDLLWRFRMWMQARITTGQNQYASSEILSNIGLAAIEIHEFSEKPLWLFASQNRESLDQFYAEVSTNSWVIGEFYDDFLGESFQPPPNDILRDWVHKLDALSVGVPNATLLPNLVYLDVVNRTIPSPYPVQHRPEPLYAWIATYDSQDALYDHIEQKLKNLKLRDLKWFNETVRIFNSFLTGKEILSELDTFLRIPVKIHNDISHYMEDLSSGEQAVLIMAFNINRWLMPGGIVLIDEPDLHLHVSMQRQLIQALKTLVEEKQGQLIITSHSPTVWESFNHRESFDLYLGDKFNA